MKRNHRCYHQNLERHEGLYMKQINVLLVVSLTEE